MARVESSRDSRRSTRLVLTIPVEVSGRDASGKEFTEKAVTKLLNKHGANILLERLLPIGTELLVRLPNMKRQQKCRVVWIGEESRDQGKWETGVELEQAENFWGVDFPPGDWIAPKQAPLAGDPSRQPGHRDPGSYDLEWLSAMFNALVAELEEKGILSRAELSERIKRMH